MNVSLFILLSMNETGCSQTCGWPRSKAKGVDVVVLVCASVKDPVVLSLLSVDRTIVGGQL